jgi:F-type H+-transporting ATPase subunit b
MGSEGFFATPANWVALAYIVFFVLVGRKLWSVIAGMLDARTNAVRAELEEARRLREEAETLLRDAKARRIAAAAEAKTLLDAARAEAVRLAAAAEQEMQAATARRERMALDRIAAAEKSAVDDVRMAAADVAVSASERLIPEVLTPQEDAALIEGAISRLAGALGRRAA